MEFERFSLWPGDGPLNARDEVIDFIVKQIEMSLREAETGENWLNYLMSYACCLKGIATRYGGTHHLTEKLVGYRAKALEIYESIDGISEDEDYENERSFIDSVFSDLIRTAEASKA